MKWMNGKNLRKKITGILTSKNLIFLNQEERKALPAAKNLLVMKMILHWMMTLKNLISLMIQALKKKMMRTFNLHFRNATQKIFPQHITNLLASDISPELMRSMSDGFHRF